MPGSGLHWRLARGVGFFPVVVYERYLHALSHLRGPLGHWGESDVSPNTTSVALLV